LPPRTVGAPGATRAVTPNGLTLRHDWPTHTLPGGGRHRDASRTADSRVDMNQRAGLGTTRGKSVRNGCSDTHVALDTRQREVPIMLSRSVM
jgi:hypothetical protein